MPVATPRRAVQIAPEPAPMNRRIAHIPQASTPRPEPAPRQPRPVAAPRREAEIAPEPAPMNRRIAHIPQASTPRTEPAPRQPRPVAASRRVVQIDALPLRGTARQRLTKAMKTLSTASSRKRR
ncbi:uncharacterized protein LOC127279883 [Leptopilina boulardi]|uniref:uncharacterized protein LOC127279883 n=1 Tax=Leptopilina boulardi TaxID=63433 RepID=UPI0021F540C4|nr:uncharacterized protein LOC127279883 [Leptopilina boulardi]